MPKPNETLEFKMSGPAGHLQALLETPADGSPIACAVVCHPHPLYAGTMHNKVAHTLARSFLGEGFAALRFNFRGVGESAGEYDDGVGEVADALAAVDWLSAEFPSLPLWLAGFSFGAAVAIKASIECKPAGLVSIAPPVRRFASDLRQQPDCPWMIVHGDKDEVVDLADTLAWVNELQPGPELLVFDGATHFFHGKLVSLREAVQEFVRHQESSNSGTQP